MSPPDWIVPTLREMKPAFIPAAWLAAMLAVSLVSCSKSDDPKRAGHPDKARPVRVAPAELRPMERVVTATGTLAAQEQATLSVKVPGRMFNIAVDLGSVVKKGDLIAQVDPADYELRLKQAVAALAQARAALGLPLDGTNDTVELEKTSLVKQTQAVLEEAARNRDRVLNLSKSGISSQSDLDTVESAHVVALNRHEAALDEARVRLAALAQRRAELDLARKQLTDTWLRAPFDGAVQTRQASLGEYQQTGTPVVTLVRTDPLRLRLEVPEREAGALRPGQTVRLRVEGETKMVTGKLARLSPAISEQNRMLTVEADIPNDGTLRPGVFVRGDIVTRDRGEGLAVPASALIHFAGLEKVVVVKEGKALERIITTGRRGSDWVEIATGLKVGDEVVLDPGNLRTGQPVVVAESRLSPANKTAEASGP